MRATVKSVQYLVRVEKDCDRDGEDDRCRAPAHRACHQPASRRHARRWPYAAAAAAALDPAATLCTWDELLRHGARSGLTIRCTSYAELPRHLLRADRRAHRG